MKNSYLVLFIGFVLLLNGIFIADIQPATTAALPYSGSELAVNIVAKTISATQDLLDSEAELAQQDRLQIQQYKLDSLIAEAVRRERSVNTPIRTTEELIAYAIM